MEPGIWPMRVVWLPLPVVAGPALAGALDEISAPVRWFLSVGFWGAWTVVLLAAFVPRATGLTAVRMAAPAAVAATAWATVVGEADIGDAVALTATLLAAVVSFAAFTADAFVDGSSYGDERRFALRTPLAVIGGAGPLAWALGWTGPVAGGLLLADGQWLIGLAVLAVGLPLAAAAVRRMHQLSRRWVVFVPAGVVLHDPLALVDPVLFRRGTVTTLGPATAADLDGTGGIDVSNGAPGLAVAVRLHLPAPLPMITGRGTAREVVAERVLFTPGRPGAVLGEARGRRLPVA